MKKYYLIPFIFLCDFLFVVYLVLPKYQLMIDSENKFKKSQAELEAREEASLALRQEVLQLEEFSSALSKIDFALPEESDFFLLFNYFQQTAFENGMIFQDMSKSQSFVSSPVSSPVSSSETPIQPSGNVFVASPKLKSDFFNVSLKGDMEAVESFLKQVESSARIITIENIDFAADSSDASSLTLSIKTHWWEE